MRASSAPMLRAGSRPTAGPPPRSRWMRGKSIPAAVAVHIIADMHHDGDQVGGGEGGVHGRQRVLDRPARR
jgi:hypothetical protein